MEEIVRCDISDGIATVRLNDPASLNAVTGAMCERLQSVLDQVERSARVMVVIGEGRAFCSGAKLSAGPAPSPADGPPDLGIMLESHINPLMARLADLGVPWISAVRGPAAGFGAALAIAADIVVAGEGAYFLQAFTNIGLVPDSGASWLLARAVGRNRAMELMLLGEKLPAAKAFEWGMVNRLVPDDRVEATALDLARKLAEGPTRTFAMVRKVAWRAADIPFAEALALERAMQCQAGRTADATEGRLAFVEKRAPLFSGA